MKKAKSLFLVVLFCLVSLLSGCQSYNEYIPPSGGSGDGLVTTTPTVTPTTTVKPDLTPTPTPTTSPTTGTGGGSSGDSSSGGGGSSGGSSGGSNVEIPLESTYQQYVKSLVSSLNVRSKPSTNSTVVGSLDKGDMVIFLEKEGDWYKTYYKHEIAYVSANPAYTSTYKMKKGSDEVEKMLSYGYKALGVPYVFGAERLHFGGNINPKFSKYAFDCSSLTQYMAYYGMGVKLDTTTRTQVSQGTYVKKEDLQRGDLMFFTNASRKDNVGVERIGHVAVYLGDNYILHTASDHAVIEEISALRWSYYIEGRRT